MKKRAAGTRTEAREDAVAMSVAMQQLMLPLLLAMEATKKGLLAFVQQMGMVALSELLAAEAAQIAGPEGQAHRGSHAPSLGHGTTPLRFGGRNVSSRTRACELAARAGREVDAAEHRGAARGRSAVRARRRADRARRVDARLRAEPGAGGRIDRDARHEQEQRDPRAHRKDDGEARAVRRAQARRRRPRRDVHRRHRVRRARGDHRARRDDRRHEDAAGHLGRLDGEHRVSPSRCATSSSAACASTHSMLFVIDGGKGIRKALRDVFGERAMIQRCQVHKMRNVRDHLPETRRAYVTKQMREAYDRPPPRRRRRSSLQLASWLDSNGEDAAAASLREGLDETLTVLRLGLAVTLCRTFSTTNAIENMNGTLRRITRNVKRWRGGDDPPLGRARHRRSAEELSSREGSRPHADPHRRASARRRRRGVRQKVA